LVLLLRLVLIQDREEQIRGLAHQPEGKSRSLTLRFGMTTGGERQKAKGKRQKAKADPSRFGSG
jgi:uncharacterized protein YjbJ (UPF0337 family)